MARERLGGKHVLGPGPAEQKNTARFRALGSTRHLAALGSSAGNDATWTVGFLANPLLAKGLRPGVGSPQMRWGFQPTVELYRRLSANRIKEMFSEAEARLKKCLVTQCCAPFNAIPGEKFRIGRADLALQCETFFSSLRLSGDQHGELTYKFF